MNQSNEGEKISAKQWVEAAFGKSPLKREAPTNLEPPTDKREILHDNSTVQKDNEKKNNQDTNTLVVWQKGVHNTRIECRQPIRDCTETQRARSGSAKESRWSR